MAPSLLSRPFPKMELMRHKQLCLNYYKLKLYWFSHCNIVNLRGPCCQGHLHGICILVFLGPSAPSNHILFLLCFNSVVGRVETLGSFCPFIFSSQGLGDLVLNSKHYLVFADITHSIPANPDKAPILNKNTPFWAVQPTQHHSFKYYWFTANPNVFSIRA